jgi:hypothetical protein
MAKKKEEKQNIKKDYSTGNDLQLCIMALDIDTGDQCH